MSARDDVLAAVRAALAGASRELPVRLRHAESERWLELDMHRTGQRSVYGELLGKRGNEEIFAIKGIAIYPEIETRRARIPLTAEQIAKLTGPVRIEYRELPENGGQLIAEVTSTVR